MYRLFLVHFPIVRKNKWKNLSGTKFARSIEKMVRTLYIPALYYKIKSNAGNFNISYIFGRRIISRKISRYYLLCSKI